MEQDENSSPPANKQQSSPIPISTEEAKRLIELERNRMKPPQVEQRQSVSSLNRGEFPPLSSTGFFVIRLIAASLLFFAILPLPGGYYQFLRLIVCGVCCYGVLVSRESVSPVWLICFGLVALLFNPIFPIHLEREIWRFIDVGSGMIILVSVIVLNYRFQLSAKHVHFWIYRASVLAVGTIPLIVACHHAVKEKADARERILRTEESEAAWRIIKVSRLAEQRERERLQKEAEHKRAAKEAEEKKRSLSEEEKAQREGFRDAGGGLYYKLSDARAISAWRMKVVMQIRNCNSSIIRSYHGNLTLEGVTEDGRVVKSQRTFLLGDLYAFGENSLEINVSIGDEREEIKEWRLRR